jgi:hypothetical protein
MSSLQHLNGEWKKLSATLAARMEQTDAGHIISSDSQFATAAWHNVLRSWRAELDALIAQYPAPARNIELISPPLRDTDRSSQQSAIIAPLRRSPPVALTT